MPPRPQEGRRQEGQGEGRGGERRSAEGQGADRDRLRRPGRAGRPGTGAGRQLRVAGGQEGPPALHPARVLLLRPRRRVEARAADLLGRRSQGDDARRRRRRLCAVGRRLEAAGPARGGVQPLRRLAQGQGGQEDRLHRQPGRRPHAGAGMGPDLRRSLAPISRFLLRRQPPRLRLAGPPSPLSAAAWRTSPTGPTSTT